MVEICRLCRSHALNSSMEPLFPTENTELVDKLYYTISVKYTSIPGLPTKICENCKSRLILAHQFKMLCQTTEEYFQHKFPKLYEFPPMNCDERRMSEDDTKPVLESEKQQPRLSIEDSATEDFQTNTYPVRPDKSSGSERVKVVINEQNRAKYFAKCEICLQYFQNLKQHQLTHSGEKSHACKVCGKSFAQIGNLNKHLNTHLDDRPHKCTVCDKGFSDSNTLKSHMIKHTGEKNYHCEFCGKSFGWSHTLAAHVRIHTQDRKFPCSQCSKKFLSRFELKKHTRTHTGDRPFHCDQCPKAFTNSGNLTTHKRIHTKIRPYQCSVCNMNFAYKSVLNNHMKTHLSVNDKKVGLEEDGLTVGNNVV